MNIGPNCPAHNVPFFQAFAYNNIHRPIDKKAIEDMKKYKCPFIVHAPKSMTLYNTDEINQLTYIDNLLVHVPNDETVPILLKQLTRPIIIENIIGNTFDDDYPIDFSLEWFESLRSPMVRLCYDTEHLYRSGVDPFDINPDPNDIIHFNGCSMAGRVLPASADDLIFNNLDFFPKIKKIVEDRNSVKFVQSMRTR